METITGTEFLNRMKDAMEATTNRVEKENMRIGIKMNTGRKPGSISRFGSKLKVIW